MWVVRGSQSCARLVEYSQWESLLLICPVAPAAAAAAAGLYNISDIYDSVILQILNGQSILTHFPQVSTQELIWNCAPFGPHEYYSTNPLTTTWILDTLDTQWNGLKITEILKERFFRQLTSYN